MRSIGEKLRDAREERGWSISELSRQTRIAEEHLEAIEEDALHTLPEGPYREAWVRTCCEMLDVEEPVHVFERPEPRIPLSVVRAIGLTSMFALVFVYAWWRWRPVAEVVDPGVVTLELDQTLVVSARESVAVKVWLDGSSALDEVLPGGAKREFSAHTEIEVQVSSVDKVKLSYNGRRVVPQGRQDAPRRLMFIDDRGR